MLNFYTDFSNNHLMWLWICIVSPILATIGYNHDPNLFKIASWSSTIFEILSAYFLHITNFLAIIIYYLFLYFKRKKGKIWEITQKCVMTISVTTWLFKPKTIVIVFYLTHIMSGIGEPVPSHHQDSIHASTTINISIKSGSYINT